MRRLPTPFLIRATAARWWTLPLSGRTHRTRIEPARGVCLGPCSANRRRGRSAPPLHHTCPPLRPIGVGGTRRHQTGFAHDVAPSWPPAEVASRWKRFLTPFG